MIWVRSQRATVVDLDAGVVLVGRDGVVRRLDGASAELVRVVLAYLAAPRSPDEIVAHVESIAGPIEDRQVIDQLVALLAETGAIATRREQPPDRPANVVVAISGAIAASHAPALIAALHRRGHTVEAALTPTAARFVAVDALCAILQREPHVSLWPRAAHVPIPHVALAHWADLVVVYPASATTIGRIANGDMSDLVSAIALTTTAPVVIAPSMNLDMLDAPAVRRNLDQLRADGHAIILGVPSEEAADAPSLRHPLASVAPAPADVVATIEAVRALGLLRDRASDGRGSNGRASGGAGSDARAWDAAYRRPLVPWQPDACDPDLIEVLAADAPPPGRLLDLGCGLGHVARHAAATGYRVVATDISEVALALARAEGGDVVWLRDDVCATALTGPFDVIVDRACLHTLPRGRAAIWGIAIDRLASDAGVVIVKCHRESTRSTTGYSARGIAALLPGFDLVAERDALLPAPADPTPIPAVLAVLRRAPRGPAR